MRSLISERGVRINGPGLEFRCEQHSGGHEEQEIRRGHVVMDARQEASGIEVEEVGYLRFTNSIDAASQALAHGHSAVLQRLELGWLERSAFGRRYRRAVHACV